jgi:large exoprotein involved in heme utilization and adhesion
MNIKKLLIGIVIFTGFSYIAKEIYYDLSKKNKKELKKNIDYNQKWKEFYYNLNNKQTVSLDKDTQIEINTNNIDTQTEINTNNIDTQTEINTNNIDIQTEPYYNNEEFNIVTMDQSFSKPHVPPNKWIEKIWS